MNEIFKKRMNVILKHGSLGAKLVDDSNILEDLFFDTDINYRKGMLYDWNMSELEEVDFKFEKVKTYKAEGSSVEYMIHFRPNYNPESIYKDNYYKQDGRERLGFYIDVYDMSKKIYEKWIIVGKDDRVSFDRYNALKCDWCFEWVSNNDYYRAIGCVRSAQDGSVNNLNRDNLGGTSVNDELSIFLPSSKDVSTIKLGTRFIISDNMDNPRTYEVIQIKDTTPLGTTKIYLKEDLFNASKDICGNLNEMIENNFCFDLPIPDLPDGFGNEYHMICDCITSKGYTTSTPTDVSWSLSCDDKYLYVDGQSVIVKAIPSKETTKLCAWHVFIDGKEYGVKTLSDYFDIHYDDTTLSIRAINKIMVNYNVKVAIWDEFNNPYDSVEMEVRL